MTDMVLNTMRSMYLFFYTTFFYSDRRGRIIDCDFLSRYLFENENGVILLRRNKLEETEGGNLRRKYDVINFRIFNASASGFLCRVLSMGKISKTIDES